MATIAVITLPLMGHMNPMVCAARALADAGHRPVFVGPVDLLDMLPDDMARHPIGETDMPAGTLSDICACLTRMTRLSDVRAMFGVIARLSQLYIDHLPAALERMGADAVLHDQLEPGAGLVARGLSRILGLGHISLACALPMNQDPSVPPPLMGWRYRPSAFGAWLNGGYYTVVNALLRQQGQVLSGAASRFGLAKPSGIEPWQQAWSVQDGLSKTADLAQGLASLDYPRAAPPLYVGPLRSPTASPYPSLASIAAERDGRPLAFISLGTLMGGRAKVLVAMAKAAIDRDLQPVLVHGGRLQAGSEMPKGTIIRDFLDQRDVLSDVAIAILHGGYNSVTDAAAAGVPMVTVPLAFEQSAIAARVERAQLGRRVSARGPNLSQRIRFALGDVLNSDTVSAAARRTQFEAMAAPGAAGLVEAINTVLAGGSAIPISGMRPVSPREKSLAALPAE